MTKASKKNLLLAISILLGTVVAASVALFNYFMPLEHEYERRKHVPPIFLPLEPFRIALQPQDEPHFLLAEFSIQVANAEDADLINLHMPHLRSRLIMILSGKKASELSTATGKGMLMQELLVELNRPLVQQDTPQKVIGIFSTSFLIQ